MEMRCMRKHTQQMLNSESAITESLEARGASVQLAPPPSHNSVDPPSALQLHAALSLRQGMI